MISRLRRLGSVVSDEGVTGGLLAIGAHLSPSPLDHRLSFTREYREQTHIPATSLPSHVAVWYEGFTPKSFVLYDFESYDPEDYISDLDEQSCWDINKPYHEFLDDKLRFYNILRKHGYGRYLPRIFGLISDGRSKNCGLDIVSLLEREEKIVIKDRTGARGNDVYICRFNNGSPQLNESDFTRDSFQERVDDLEGHLVTEFCEQAGYAESIYPMAPNTVRLLTMNPSQSEPFISRAVHRIASVSSGTLDNFSRGGLSADINADGVIGPAVRYQGGEVTWHDTHPDTGSRIAGVKIPRWDRICETVLSIVSNIPEFKYVGWDVIVTNEGFKIIEGNTNTDTDLIQAHAPLLVENRVREFYREHDIVS